MELISSLQLHNYPCYSRTPLALMNNWGPGGGGGGGWSKRGGARNDNLGSCLERLDVLALHHDKCFFISI